MVDLLLSICVMFLFCLNIYSVKKNKIKEYRNNDNNSSFRILMIRRKFLKNKLKHSDESTRLNILLEIYIVNNQIDKLIEAINKDN